MTFLATICRGYDLISRVNNDGIDRSLRCARITRTKIPLYENENTAKPKGFFIKNTRLPPVSIHYHVLIKSIHETKYVSVGLQTYKHVLGMFCSRLKNEDALMLQQGFPCTSFQHNRSKMPQLRTENSNPRHNQTQKTYNIF